jgi:hypothetical protein
MAAVRIQQAYDHRVRVKVFQGERDIKLSQQQSIPRSTIATWRAHPPRRVLTLACDQASQLQFESEALLAEIQQLRKRLAAMRSLVILLVTVLQLSGFTLDGQRLPDGKDKQRLLRSIRRASQYFSLSHLLKRIGLSSSRYHAWSVTKACQLSDASSCPRTHPTQLTSDEHATIGKLLQAPEYSHVPTGTLIKLAQRLKLAYASSATWYRLIRLHKWRRPRKRIHPSKPTFGVRANRPNEIWHVDISIVKLLDGTRVYLQAVMDNFSRKVLAHRVTDKYDPTATATLLEDAAHCLSSATDNIPQPAPTVSLYCDGGVENFNEAVDQVLSRFQIVRVQAQIDVQFSNSMIEAFWRSTKHNCLFQQRLDSLAAIQRWVAFYVQQHNEVMPHSAYQGQTPNEMFFGTGNFLEAELKQARETARQSRIDLNRKRTCAACVISEPEMHTIQLDKP